MSETHSFIPSRPVTSPKKKLQWHDDSKAIGHDCWFLYYGADYVATAEWVYGSHYFFSVRDGRNSGRSGEEITSIKEAMDAAMMHVRGEIKAGRIE